MQTVLVVEDDLDIQNAYRENLSDSFTFISAGSVDDGYRKFIEARPHAVVIDGDLGRGEFGHTLADLIRATGFRGPMIAASSDFEQQQLLRANGCGYTAAQKMDVPDLVVRLLA